MLDKIRQQSQSAIILLLFGFIIFVFVFSFGAGSEGFRSGGCGRAGIAAMVNGEGISDMHFQFHYDQQLRMALSKKKQGSFLRREDKLALRQQVMETLIDQALLIQAAQQIARERQHHRFGRSRIQANARMTNRHITQHRQLDADRPGPAPSSV